MLVDEIIFTDRNDFRVDRHTVDFKILPSGCPGTDVLTGWIPNMRIPIIQLWIGWSHVPGTLEVLFVETQEEFQRKGLFTMAQQFIWEYHDDSELRVIATHEASSLGKKSMTANGYTEHPDGHWSINRDRWKTYLEEMG